MNTKNKDLHIESLVERLAPMKSKPGQIEQYNVEKIEGLAGRLGVTMDQLAVMAEAGLLTPIGDFTHSSHGSMAAFDGSDLDRIRRGAILDGLNILAGRNPSLDSHDLAAVAATANAQAKRKPQAKEFSTGDRFKIKAALQRARAGTINFSESKKKAALMQVGAKCFGAEFNSRLKADEAGVPFTRKIAADRYIKKVRDEDVDRGIASSTKAAAVGAVSGALAPRGKFKLRAGKRALIGAAAGAAGVLATRIATSGTRDIYGERSRGAKKAESTLPAVGALAIGGALLKKRLTGRIFSNAEKTILFDAYQEQTGRDLRCLQSAYTDPDVIEFAIAGILPLAGKILRGAGRQLLTPGSTANTVAKGAAVGAGLGGVAGSIGSMIDGDEETGVVGGFLKGAKTGAAVGAGGAAIKSASPELMRRAKSYFRKAGPLQTPSGPAALKQGPRFRWSGPSDFDVS